MRNMSPRPGVSLPQEFLGDRGTFFLLYLPAAQRLGRHVRQGRPRNSWRRLTPGRGRIFRIATFHGPGAASGPAPPSPRPPPSCLSVPSLGKITPWPRVIIPITTFLGTRG